MIVEILTGAVWFTGFLFWLWLLYTKVWRRWRGDVRRRIFLLNELGICPDCLESMPCQKCGAGT